ncbi:receptor-like protein EIX2 [Tanacetum coccineum]
MITTSSNVTCIEKELESLLVFRHGLTDESNRLSTWTGVECCAWQGVGCDRRNGHVVKLDLRSPLFFIDTYTLNTSNWLQGKVSPSLLNLKHLRYLDLSMNNFSAQNIPEFFGSFKYLEYLNLSYSGFIGVVPPHLGNLSRLQYLDLKQNEFLVNSFKVSLPYDVSLMVNDLRWVSLLSSLKHLDFSGITIGNHIDWFHPVNMLPSLLTLNLGLCNIIIPSIKFINFTSLNTLDLSSNGINSTIPVWLLNLTRLVHLDLHNNSFYGRIPDSIVTLSSLSFIDLSSNRFNTSMPGLFWNFSSLVSLDLSYNAFHGPVPADVKLCNLSVLNLSGNEFEGDFPSLIGNMSSDCLHNSLKNLILGGNQFKGSIPNKLGEFKKLEKLFLLGNRLSGPIPPSLGGLSSLKEIALDGNRLNGTIPESFGQLSMLGYLSVPDNQLSGSVPESIGQLSMLQNLYLKNNSLVGFVSEIHFTKLNILTYLSLSYNSLTLNVSSHWVPPFQLRYFDARSCNIGPQFPNWLQTQTHLGVLAISNSSIRDRIPDWFENISSTITYLDLSNNQISGKLPRFNGSGIKLLTG